MSEQWCMYKDGMCELDVDEAYQQGKADALNELFCLAKEFAYDDGVDYSISLYDLDNIITELKGCNNE